MPTLSRTTLLILLTLTSLFSQKISGVIKDKETGTPIMAASISTLKTGESTFSEEDGTFTLDIDFRKDATITVNAVGYANHQYEVTTTDDRTIYLIKKAAATAICDTCPGPKLIMGEIVDAEINTGITDVTLSVNDETVATSDENGFFSFVSAVLSQDVTFTHGSYPDTTLTVTATSKDGTSNRVVWQPRVLRASLAGVFSGTITDDTKPLSDATITLLSSDKKTSSNQNGKFTIDTLFAGKHTLMVTKSGYNPNVFTIEIREKQKLNKTIVLEKRSEQENQFSQLAGTVKSSEGNLVSAGFARIDSLNLTVDIKSDGTFAFDSLPSGIYSVTLWAEGNDTTLVHDIELWAGEDKKEEFALKALSLASTLTYEKGMGAVTGLIVAQADGKTLGGATISLKSIKSGKVVSAVAQMDGSFTIMTKKGTYTLTATSSGYSPKELKELTIAEGKVEQIDLLLSQSDVTTMAKLSVRGTTIKSGSAALLKERQQTFEVVDAVGAEQFSRTGASSAADAMRQITGATIVDGKYVIVRGLPAKYSLVMLNGSVVPSADPDENAVNMDIFPTGIIDNIKVYKTFQSIRPANFAGGIIDIGTKSFPEEPTFSVGLSGSMNTGTAFSNKFLTTEQGKRWGFGFDDGTREIPEILKNTSKSFMDQQAGILSDGVISDDEKAQADLINPIAKSLSKEMTPQSKTAAPNLSSSLSYGNSLERGDKKFGYNLSFTYKNGRKMKDNQVYRKYMITNPYTLYAAKDFLINDSKERVLWSLLANSAYKFNKDHTISLDYLMLHDGENRVKEITGVFPNSEAGEDQFYTSRLHYIERHMNYLKVSGNHRFQKNRNGLDLFWNGSYTATSQDEPDLRDYYHFYNSEGGYYHLIGTMGDPKHSWRSVSNTMGTADLGFKLPFYQWSDDSATITFGAGWQGNTMERTSREFYYDMGNTQNPNQPHTFLQDDSLGFTQQNGSIDVGILVKEATQGSAQREGDQQIFSQFAQLELPINSKLSTIVGLRGEKVSLYDHTTDEAKKAEVTPAELDGYDLLPSTIATFKPNDKQVIKAAFGKTLIRPSLREKAPYQTAGFTGGGYFVGNADLEISYIYNSDVRWEMFPNPGELFAVGGFFKRIKKPIETSFLPNDVTKPINSENDANIIGIETEFAKSFSLPRDVGLNLSGNVTLVYSRVNLSGDNLKNEIYMPEEEPHRPFQGQSPIVINLVSAFEFKKIGLSSSLYYNFFGTRLAELTDPDSPYLWEKPEHLLNLTASKEFNDNLKLSFKAKNLLNPEKEYYQEYKGKEYIQRSSRKGIEFSLGLSYKIKGNR